MKANFFASLDDEEICALDVLLEGPPEFFLVRGGSLGPPELLKRQMHDFIECLNRHEELDVKVVDTLLNHADESVVTKLLSWPICCLDENAATEKCQSCKARNFKDKVDAAVHF